MKILNETIKNITSLDQKGMKGAQNRLDSLTKPKGSLGVLEDLVIKLAGIQGKSLPEIKPKRIIIMAGDHGVVEEGVSAYPSEVTPQMVLNFLNEGAAINVLTKHSEAEITCVDIGVASDMDYPGLVSKKIKKGTDNMAKGPAMTKDEAVKALETGIEVVAEEIKKGTGVIGTGEMGIGNTTPSSAILGVYSKEPLDQLVGKGTGLDDKNLTNKIKTIQKAIGINKPDANDPIDVLSKVGGLEIGGIAGCILGAASKKVPVVIDGFISTAAAIIAAKLEPKALDYMIASHVSMEPGHRIMLETLGLEPMLHMKMRLGEGTGAALAFNMIDGAIKIARDMATFKDAGVSGELD